MKTLPQPQQMPKDAGPAALRTCFNILERWNVAPEEAQVLLSVPKSTFYRWKGNPQAAHLTHDTIERLSYILGIFKALRLIYSDHAIADSWLRRPNSNPVFGGQAPLQRLLGGQVADLFLTRQLLDARRGVI